jgi:hypothetical protein
MIYIGVRPSLAAMGQGGMAVHEIGTTPSALKPAGPAARIIRPRPIPIAGLTRPHNIPMTHQGGRICRGVARPTTRAAGNRQA